MNKRKIGSDYEELAAQYLMSRGYQILDRNYHAGRKAEIDIVAAQGRTLVFTEVKYRADGDQGDPLEAVTYAKQRSISMAALHYLSHKGYGTDHPCRFDVIGINGRKEIRHQENAFDYAGF